MLYIRFYNKTNTISLDGLAEGIYFLILENKNLKNIYKKFTKQNNKL